MDLYQKPDGSWHLTREQVEWLNGAIEREAALKAEVERKMGWHPPDCEAVAWKEVERLRGALRELTSWAGDLVQAWEAHKQLQSGFSGMGHNILVETAAKYGSMTYWNRLAKAVEQARAALRGEEEK
jgi:hypothetical protein